MKTGITGDKETLYLELKSLTDDLTDNFYQRHCNLSKLQLRQLIKFAKKGHSLIPLNDMMTIPKVYFRLLDTLDDISEYPCLCNYKYLRIKPLEELEVVIARKLNDYMYKTYAHLINDNLRKQIYNLLVSNVDITKDVDYLNVEEDYAENYVRAIRKGYSKKIAGNLLFAVKWYFQDDVIRAYNQGVDVRKLFNMDLIIENGGRKFQRAHLYSDSTEYERTFHRNEKLASKFQILTRHNLDAKKYEGLLSLDLKYNQKYYIYFINLTNQDFVPDVESDNSPYLQYLEHIGAIEKDSELAKYEREHLANDYHYNSLTIAEPQVKDFHNKLILKEMAHKFNMNLDKYLDFSKHFTRYAFICVALGEDISTYLALNLGDNLNKILTKVIVAKKCNSVLNGLHGFEIQKY